MSNNKFKTPTRGELFQGMVSNYEQYYTDGDTQITDLSEGSELGTLLNSICVELEALYLHDALLCDQKFVKTASGSFLDLLACEHHLTRQQGTYASTYCTFSLLGDLQTQDVIIPSGTRIIHRSNGNVYILQNDVKIYAASRTATGRVVALYTGEEYNAEINTLTSFEAVGTFSGSISVTNYSPVTGGTNTETDESLRLRILDSNENNLFGSIGWYTSQLMDRSGIHDVNFVNPNDETIEHALIDGTDSGDKCTECTRVVFVNIDDNEIGGTTETERQFNIDSVLFDATTWIENQNNMVVGHKFHVQQANEEQFFLEIRAYDSREPTEEEILEALTAYFRGGTFSSGGSTYTYPGINIEGTITRGAIMDVLEKIECIEQVEMVNRLKWNPHKYEQAYGNWKYTDTINDVSYYEHTDAYGYVFMAQDIGSKGYENKGYYDAWGRMPLPTTTLGADTCAVLGDMTTYKTVTSYMNGGGTISDWRTLWKDIWYNDNFNTIMYTSLGSALNNDGISTTSNTSRLETETDYE